MAKDFALDDLVWAKMKGFPPWPAKISEPPEGSTAKSKKPQHFVYFFGTHDVAWILDELIFPHSEEMLMSSCHYKKKSTTLQSAIDEIKEESLKVPPKPKKPEKGKKETPRNISPEPESTPGSSKTGNKETPSNTPLDSTPGTSKIPKKSLPKKKIVKKRPKKRPVPDNDQGQNSLKPEDYSLLVANVPPNNALAHVAVIPPYDGQVALASDFTNPYALAGVLNKPKTKKHLPPNKKKLGFLGLGVMGSLMVRHLLKSKHNVTIWNRTIEKCDEFIALGAHAAEAPCDLVRMCDIIFCCLSDAEALKAVFFLRGGALEGFSGGGTSKDIGNKGYVEMTSIDPTTSQEVYEAVCEEGGRYLEAPMIGSRQQLEGGTIFIIGSGDRSLFTECDTCFNVWSRHSLYFSSEVGSASKMNLLMGMVLGTTYAVLAEALALVERCGVDPEKFMKSLKDGPLNCPLVVSKAFAMLEKKAVVEHPVKHLQKDLDMAIALSNNYDQPLVLTVAVNEVFKRAKRDYAEKDVTAIHKCHTYECLS